MFNFSMLVGAAMMALVAYGLHSCDVNKIEAKHKAAMEKQSTAINQACAIAKATTTKVSNDLQNNLSVLDADAAALGGMFLRACQRPAPGLAGSTAAGHDAAAAGQEPAERIVRTFEPTRIINITKKGERYRVQLLACQAYVNDVQKAAEGR